MTDEDRNTILLIKGAISELTPEEQQKCKQIAEQIARMVLDAGEAGGWHWRWLALNFKQ